MANVKVRAGIVRNVAGAPLVGKVATLKNHATDAPIAAGTTDGTGAYSFTGIDETIRTRVEVAFGGGSAQMHVNAPISPDLDHAYINSSLRTAAAATVVFGGALTVTGQLVLGSGLSMATTNAAIELGNTSGVNTPLIDFHSSGIANDFDSRIYGSGGAAGNGLGAITLLASLVGVNGQLAVTGQLLASFGSAGVPGVAFVGDENTGLFRNNEGQISMVSNGTIRLSMTTVGAQVTGSLGVDTTLVVNGTSALNNTVAVSGLLSANGGLGVSGASTLNGTVNVGGQIIVPGGSIGAPALTFVGDTNTGLVNGGDGGISFISNGVDRFKVDTTGATVVGAASVSAGLTVNGGLNVASSNVNVAAGNVTVSGTLAAGSGTFIGDSTVAGNALDGEPAFKVHNRAFTGGGPTFDNLIFAVDHDVALRFNESWLGGTGFNAWNTLPQSGKKRITIKNQHGAIIGYIPLYV